MKLAPTGRWPAWRPARWGGPDEAAGHAHCRAGERSVGEIKPGEHLPRRRGIYFHV